MREERTLKALFSSAAVLTGALGVLWLFFPQIMFHGLLISEPDAITVYMARRYGALFFGYATMLWLGRASPRSPALTAMLAGGTLVSVVIGAVSTIGALTGVVGPAIWGAMLIEAVLAGAFAFHWRATRSWAEGQKT